MLVIYPYTGTDDDLSINSGDKLMILSVWRHYFRYYDVTIPSIYPFYYDVINNSTMSSLITLCQQPLYPLYFDATNPSIIVGIVVVSVTA